MKFYYNGKLMRTSKNHDYKYAIVSANDGLWSCHSTLEAAEKEYRRPIAEAETNIHDDMVAIEMLNMGRNYYEIKICKRWHRISLKGKDKAYFENHIESNKARIENLKTRRIVELEARA
jgi:PIN domain nuclease of toxin-antitoxin system